MYFLNSQISNIPSDDDLKKSSITEVIWTCIQINSILFVSKSQQELSKGTSTTTGQVKAIFIYYHPIQQYNTTEISRGHSDMHSLFIKQHNAFSFECLNSKSLYSTKSLQCHKKCVLGMNTFYSTNNPTMHWSYCIDVEI